MLRSRNSFFSQSSMNYQNYIPNNNIIPQPNIQTGSQTNSFYQGPINEYPNQGYQSNQNYIEDYDNRLAKIERAINRLDARITKLENTSQITTEEINNTMYMV